MKTYRVRYEYHGAATVEVEASSREEAIARGQDEAAEIAQQNMYSYSADAELIDEGEGEGE